MKPIKAYRFSYPVPNGAVHEETVWVVDIKGNSAVCIRADGNIRNFPINELSVNMKVFLANYDKQGE